MNKVLGVLIGLALMASASLWFFPGLVGNDLVMQDVLEPGLQSININPKTPSDVRLATIKTEHKKKLEPKREVSNKNSNGINISQYLTSSIVYTSTPFAVIHNTRDNSMVTVRSGDTLQPGLRIVEITKRSVVVEQGGKTVALRQEEIDNSAMMAAIETPDNATYASDMGKFLDLPLDEKIASIMSENPTEPVIDMNKLVTEGRNLLVYQMPVATKVQDMPSEMMSARNQQIIDSLMQQL